jgi:formamidopyrimidine-DNA glycosylase
VPELPEVETIRAALAPALEGRQIEDVAIDDPRLTRPHDPREVEAELVGEEIVRFDRRGKYLVVRFRTSRALLIHLRMTGSLHYAPDRTLQDDPHRRAVIKLDNDSDVAYRDVRRFGTWLLLEPDEVKPYLDLKNGPEPLEREFTTRFLAGRLHGRRAPVKAAILDQRTIAGLGNIYADEGLWHARIHPLRPAGALDAEEVSRVRSGARRALKTGIARQGATLRDYRTPEGRSGSMQEEFRVYGRAGEPCPRCGTPIEKIRAGGRGTWYCPSCQRLEEPQRTSSTGTR